MRSIEALVLAVMFAIWLGFGPFAGVMAMTVVTVASLSKLFSEALVEDSRRVGAMGGYPLKSSSWATPGVPSSPITTQREIWDTAMRPLRMVCFLIENRWPIESGRFQKSMDCW
jgi:hypothetical protein